MNPGATTSPRASRTVRPRSGVREMAAMRPVADADRPDAVEPRLRVDDAPVGQHEVEGAALGSTWGRWRLRCGNRDDQTSQEEIQQEALRA